jgi:hypothetical protein
MALIAAEDGERAVGQLRGLERHGRMRVSAGREWARGSSVAVPFGMEALQADDVDALIAATAAVAANID